MNGFLLLRISWRNIWRSPVRSLVLISSVALGIWSGVFILAFANGLNLQRTESAILSGMGHAQVHEKDYRSDPQIGLLIKGESIIQSIQQSSSHWQEYSFRLVMDGMAASARTASGVKILGVDPELEASLNTVSEKIIEGEWLDDSSKLQIVIGQELAEKLGLKLGSRMVVTLQDANEELVSLAYRIKGIYKTGNRGIDEFQVFTLRSKMADGIGLSPDSWHELSLLHSNAETLEVDAITLQSQIGDDMEVASWRTLSPELGYADETMATMLFIFMGIILMALAFGIINNMQMAVLERKKELGMLMAIGMNRFKVFLMIVIETLLISFIGAPIGLILGACTNWILAETGLDMSFYQEGLEEFGIDSVIYPILEAYRYGQISIMVIITGLLSSLSPAYRVLRMNPIETIRSI